MHGQRRLFHVGLDADVQCRRGSQGVAIALSARGVEAWKAAFSVVPNDLGARVIAIRMVMQGMQNSNFCRRGCVG